MADWLSREPRLLWIAITIAIMPLLYNIWCTAITGLYSWFGVLDQMIASHPNASMQATWALWGIMIPWVLGEEVLFRFPLSFAARFLRRWERLRNWAIIILVIGLSAAFGWVHGGWLFVPMQGVLGAVFCLIYLKCGGFNGKFWKPLLICWIMHVVVNSHLFGLQALLE